MDKSKPGALAHDLLRQERHPLDPLFAPRGVAVVGATETPGSVGRTLLWNLISNPFGGTVYPVNPKRPSVLGIRAYPSVRELPAPVDLAVVATPAPTVPDVIAQCAEAGVSAAIIISAGFREVGPAGAALEARVLEAARRGRMRLVGPNCLGIMSPTTGLNATFAGAMARPGNIALLSQSGALLTGILDWSLREQVGFSACVSAGAMLDVGWGDLIDYFGDDPRTRAILVYMESVGEARSFLSAAREVSLSKPIIVIKPGRSEAAARAAASHTGALTGSDDVLDAAFRRCGVLRVDRIGDLFSMAEVLGRQPRPSGPRLAIVTNAGGPGVLATDVVMSEGGQLAPLSAETKARLDQVLPAAWSHGNPIDVLGDAGPDRYAQALDAVAADPTTDGVLVVLTPQDMTDPTITAERLKGLRLPPGKPLLASWMGGAAVQAGVDILNRAGVPTFSYPDAAAGAFCAMWRHAEALRGLYETPVLGAGGRTDPARVSAIVHGARAAGRTLLDEHESKQLLAAYGLPVTETRLARSVDEAVREAAAIGFPVVVKLHSHTLTHKTDVGGVRLGLTDGPAVARAFDEIRASVSERAGAEHFLGVTVQPMVRAPDAYEVILGSALDPQFGPVIVFGAGGQLVEVFRDRAIGLPPLNSTLARRLMEGTRILTALRGVRGRAPADLAALEATLVRFSELVVEHPAIKEVDLNPLLVGPGTLVALDARVILHPPEVAAEHLPRPAIRPYPTKYVQPWRAPDGETLMIRPIRPEDEPLLVAYHQKLSERSVRMRYLGAMKLDTRTAHERLVRVCFIDYGREMALVVERPGAEGRPREIVGVGRLSQRPYQREAEFSLLIVDEWHGRGLGTELLQRLVAIGRDEGLIRITAEILPENQGMRRVAERVGFHLHQADGDPVLTAELRL